MSACVQARLSVVILSSVLGDKGRIRCVCEAEKVAILVGCLEEGLGHARLFGGEEANNAVRFIREELVEV